MASLKGFNKQLDMARSNLKNTKKDMEGLTAAGKALGTVGRFINSDSFKMASNSAETLIATNKIKQSYDQILERGKQLFAIGKSGQSLKPYQQEIYELKKEITSLIGHSQNLANVLNTSIPETKPEKVTKTYAEIIKQMEWMQAKNKDLITTEEKLNYIKKERTLIPQGTDDSLKALQLQRKLEEQLAKEHDEDIKRQQEAIIARKRADDEQFKLEAKAAEESKRLWDEKIRYIKQVLSGIVSAVQGVVSVILGIVKTAFNGVVKIINSVRSTVTKILTLFSNFGDRIRQAFGFGSSAGQAFHFNLLDIKGTINSLISLGGRLKSTFNQMFNNETINTGKKLLSSIYSIGVVTKSSNVSQEVITWAQKMEDAYGLSARNIISQMGELSAVIGGLGMSGEHNKIASMNLMTAGNYLAMMGLAGGDSDTVISKIISGMKGMTASVDDLGLSVREAEMDSFLKELKAQGGEFANIGTSFASLNEEARVYVRYASLMNQLSNNFSPEKYIESLNTVTGRLNILNQTWSSLLTLIGTGFTKIASYVAQYLIPIIKTLQDVVASFFSWLGGVFGADFSVELDNKANGNVYAGVAEDISGVNEELEKVEKNADKASGALQGFDKLNNINTSSSDSSSGSAGDFDYSSLMNLGTSNLIEGMENATNSYFDQLEANLGERWVNIKGIFTKIKDEFKGFFEDLFADIGLESLLEKVNTLFDDLAEALNKSILPALSPALDKFYSVAIQPFAEKIGKALGNNLDWVINKVNEFSKWFADPSNSGTINKWFENIGEIFASIGGVVEPIVKQLCTWFDEGVTAIGGWLGSLTDDQKTEKITGFFDKLKTIVEDSLSIVNNLFKNVLLPLMKELGAWFVTDGIDWFSTKIKEVGDYLSTHGEEIRSLLSDIGGIVWTGFKTFVDILSGAIKLLIDNPDIAKLLFMGLAGKAILDPGVTSGAKQAGSGVGNIVAGGVGLAGGAALANGGLSGLARLGSTLAAIAGQVAIIGAAIAGMATIMTNTALVSESFRDTIGMVFGEIGGVINDAISRFTGEGGLGEGLKSLKQGFDDLCLAIEPLLTVMITFAGGCVSFMIAQLANAADFILSTVKNVIDLVIGIITLDAEKIMDSIANLILGIIQFLAGSVVNFLEAGIHIIVGLARGLEQGWEKVKTKVKELWQGFITEFKDFFGIHSPSTLFAGFGKNIVEGLKNGIVDAWNTLISKLTGLFDDLKTKIKGKVDEIKSWVTDNPIVAGVQTAWDGITNKTSNTTVRVPSILGNANGGAPRSGSLFYANENGNSELVGNFGGYTGVANQSMIIQAMKQAVYEAMTAANSGNGNSVNINIPDRQLFTKREVVELVNQLMPYISSNQHNIANRAYGI